MRILAENLNFPEGPAFDPDGHLWCVELHNDTLVRWTDGEIERYPTGGGEPNGIAFTRGGHAIFCDEQRNTIRRFNPFTAEFSTLADTVDGEKLLATNDLAFDAAGNCLFTCPGHSEKDPIGYVCCLSPDGAVGKIAEHLQFPNGLAFTDDGDTLVIAETFRQRLWKGRWDAPTRTWIDPQPWAGVGGDIGPDGMAFDTIGNCYVALFGSGRLAIVDTSGQIIGGFDLPGKNPTNVVFDPSGELGIVVTESEKGLLLSFPAPAPGLPLYDGGDAWA